MEQFRPIYGNPYSFGQGQAAPGYLNFGQMAGQQPPIPVPVQQMQQPQRPSVVPGRTVASENEIKPNEIPMDGTISLFPLSDYSAIFAKQWKSDGLTAMNNALNLAASQQAQNAYLVEQMKRCSGVTCCCNS